MASMACARSCSCGAQGVHTHRSSRQSIPCYNNVGAFILLAFLLLSGNISVDASRRVEMREEWPRETLPGSSGGSDSGGGSSGSSRGGSSSSRRSLNTKWPPSSRIHLRKLLTAALGKLESDLDMAAAAAAAAASKSQSGRSLKQIAGYDPYGIGYYDPYVAGITPGFVNLDLNRETGLHLGVGDAVVDVSADKNYVGFGLGQGLGFGKAKDRGWNLQLGGGNILDVSVTKDAGLGLWVLDGLLNVNIGPDGSDNSKSDHFAQDLGAAESAPDVTSVVVDESMIANSAGATQVVVDDTTAMYQTYTAGDAGFDPNVEHNPPIPVYSTDENADMSPPIPTYTSSSVAEGSLAYPMYTTESESNAVQVEEIPTYTTGLENTLPSYDFLQNLSYDTSEAAPAYSTEAEAAYTTQAEASGATPTYMVPRPAAAEDDEAVWSTASQYSDTARIGAARLSGLTFSGPAAAVGAGAVPTAAPSLAAVPAAQNSAVSRRACHGGEMVWVSGSKYKCRYQRAKGVQVAPGQSTYANGIAV